MALPAGVPVTVRVRTTAGEPVGDAYVALVPVWRPWSRPLQEAIAEKGVSVLRVPAGNYHLTVGAMGFEISTSGPLAISPISTNDFSVELRALKPVTGNVSDEQGNPMAGVLVAGVNAAISAPLGMLSELGVRHAGSQWSARTDKGGSWTLGLPEGTIPLVFEAPGRAAEMRFHRATDPAALDIAMSKGATLRLTTDRADPDLIVTLQRQGADVATEIPADWQPQIWARRAATTSLIWDSLPAGEYAIYAKYAAPRYFMQKAKKLTTVAVSPGEPRDVRVILPAAARPAKNSMALFLQGFSRKDLGEGMEGFARDSVGLVKRVDLFVEDVIGGSVVHLRSEGARPPFYVLTTDRFLSTVPDLADVRDDANAEPWPAAVHPRADVQLHLSSAEKELQFPSAGTAVLNECNKAKRVTVPIEIGKDNRARFSAPAGCRSVVMVFDPFEPVVLEKPLRAGDQALGEFVLRAGGAAGVRVAHDPGGAVIPGATVRVMTPSDERPDRSSVLLAEAVTSDDGWAHVSGLPVFRDLRLVAETPGGAKSVAVELRLEPRGRQLVDPLAVPEPATLIVEATIDETFRARFLAARVMAVLIHPSDPHRHAGEKRQENVREENASIRFEPLHPGKWRISGIVRVAGTIQPIEIEEIELKAGETRRLRTALHPLVFEGRITAAGRGVAARIAIEDRFTPGGVKQFFDSAGNGNFHVVLARRGTYSVEAARLSSQGDVIPIGEVDFTDTGRRMELVISEGSVTARVRAEGRAVAGVMVLATLRRDSRGSVNSMDTVRGTDSDGEATFEGMLPGVWTFSVRDKQRGRGAEKAMAVRVGEDVEVDLDLDRTASIEGTVRDLGGVPLPRAGVDCLFVGPAGIPETVGVLAGWEGKFTIDLNAPAPSSAFCSVTGPMGTVDSFKATPGQPIDVSVPPATGTLRIPDWGTRKSPDAFWLVAPDGRVISLSAVATRIGRFASPLTIPALAAGRWKVVRIESLSQWLALGSGMAGSLPTVAEIALNAGATETIQLYDIPARGGSE